MPIPAVFLEISVKSSNIASEVTGTGSYSLERQVPKKRAAAHAAALILIIVII